MSTLEEDARELCGDKAMKPIDRALDDQQDYMDTATGHLERISRWQASPDGQVYRLCYDLENLVDALKEAVTDPAKLELLDNHGDSLLLIHQEFGRVLLNVSRH